MSDYIKARDEAAEGAWLSPDIMPSQHGVIGDDFYLVFKAAHDHCLTKCPTVLKLVEACVKVRDKRRAALEEIDGAQGDLDNALIDLITGPLAEYEATVKALK